MTHDERPTGQLRIEFLPGQPLQFFNGEGEVLSPDEVKHALAFGKVNPYHEKCIQLAKVGDSQLTLWVQMVY